MKIGQLAVKIAGKDAGKTVVVVDNEDKNFVTIDGDVKRKRCNITHLEPLEKEVDIKKNASHSEIIEVFKKLKLEIKDGTKERKTKVAGKIHRTTSDKPTDTRNTRADK